MIFGLYKYELFVKIYRLELIFGFIDYIFYVRCYLLALKKTGLKP